MRRGEIKAKRCTALNPCLFVFDFGGEQFIDKGGAHPLFGNANRILLCPFECGCGCTSSSQGATWIDLFDVMPEGGIGPDGGCDVTVYEVVNSGLIGLGLTPDLDLFDEQGDFAPNQDGVDDAWSLGIYFTAVPATFTLPAGVGSGG